jgi:stage V sporulation protein B
MKQTFLQGAIILIAAGFITKLLGFINRIVMARLLGPEGVGLYMMAVPILSLVITLTRLGLPVAISKLVAEAEAQGDVARIRRILVVSLAVTSVLSLLFTSLTFAGAHLISGWLLTDQRAYWALIAITPIVPIVAVSSVIKGYFQGRQNMRPPAFSLVIEQVVRISLVALLVIVLLPYGIEFAAAGAMISVVLGEAAALIYLTTKFKFGRLRKPFPIRKGFLRQLKNGKETLDDLLRIGLPATGSGLIGSLSWTFEPILVAQSLAAAGVATVAATEAYGLLAGYAIPLLMLPTFITYSLSVSLVPAISEAQAMRNSLLIRRRLYQALRLALITGAPATVIMTSFAAPLTSLVYGTQEAASLLKVLAPFSLLLYFQGPLQAALQGLDLAKTAMFNTLYGAVIKMGAILLLASRPELGIFGAALAININICLVTLLHFFSVVKAINGLSIPIIDLGKVGLAMVIMTVGGRQAYQWAGENFPFSPSSTLLLAIALALFLYLCALLALKLIGQQDIERIPFIGKRLAPYFPKR